MNWFLVVISLSVWTGQVKSQHIMAEFPDAESCETERQKVGRLPDTQFLCLQKPSEFGSKE